jgi:hypothetical protein
MWTTFIGAKLKLSEASSCRFQPDSNETCEQHLLV